MRQSCGHLWKLQFITFCKLLHIYVNFYLFISGCAGSSLLRGLSLVAVRGLLIVMASLVAERGLSGVWISSFGSRALEHRLNSCGAQAQLLCSICHLPRPGTEPMPPALAGGFFTTEPPGKPSFKQIYIWLHQVFAALWHVGSQLPKQGSDLGSLQWEHGVLAPGTPGKGKSPFPSFLAYRGRNACRYSNDSRLWSAHLLSRLTSRSDFCNALCYCQNVPGVSDGREFAYSMEIRV